MDKIQPCLTHPRCGSCEYFFDNYPEQLKLKRQAVLTAFRDITFPKFIEPTVGMYYPFKYRNKLHLAFCRDGNRVKIGFFEKNSRNVCDIKNCHLHSSWADTLTHILRSYIKDNQVQVTPSHKDNIQPKGLRYAVARHLSNNKLMLTLVTADYQLPSIDLLYQALTQEFCQVSLYQNINTANTTAVLSDEFIHKLGEKSLTSKICGIDFLYFPGAFIQVNDQITTKIYNKIIEQAQIDDKTIVYDIYSGTGITSALFAKAGAMVYSIELSKGAVKSAIAKKKLNGLSSKIINIQGDAGKELAKLSTDLDYMKEDLKAINTIESKNSPCPAYQTLSGGKHKQIVFVDPPKSGLDTKVIKAILHLKPQQIIYLSCNLETLARDLKEFLKQKDYTITSVIPYDMFPQTKHVETLVFLKETLNQSVPYTRRES